MAAPEDTPDNPAPQEAPSELTELDGTTGSTTPRAASPWRAGTTPAIKADAPESQTNWDAHLSAGEGIIAGENSSSRDEKSSTDEYCDTYSHLTIDNNSPVFGSNTIVSAESTRIQTSKKSYPLVEDLQGKDPPPHILGLTPEQGRVVNLARQSLTDEERELIARRADQVCQAQKKEKIFWAEENFSASEGSDPEIDIPDKGKGADPQNWGALNLPVMEMDKEVQRALLSTKDQEKANDRKVENHRQCLEQEPVSNTEPPTVIKVERENGETTPQEMPSRDEIKKYLRNQRELAKELNRIQQKQRTAHNKRERAGSAPVSSKLAKLIGRVTKSQVKPSDLRERRGTSLLSKDPTRPFAQVTGKSALGQAFRNLEDTDGSEPSDSSSSSSSSSDSGLDTESSNYNSESDYLSDTSDDTHSSTDSLSEDSEDKPRKRRRDRRRGRNKGKRGKKSKKTRRSRSRGRDKRQKTLIKPTPPEKYGGQAEYRAFQKFLTHGTAYVKYGYVEKQRQVMVLSEFLTGRAYTFYTRRVSLAPHRWTLKEFFTELFNYCFPIDYRNQQRVRLDKFEQGG
ncbi:hypothetical protein J132_10965 [Termitomyces sp. J132]|nr:hypothetical protein J132_10965 [Termitomyces sp. J132]